MARRKIVLVIVEGESDETALGVALNKVYDKDAVYIHIMHGDITTRNNITAQNIVAALGKDIKNYAVSHHYTQQDFRQIIHIVDTDGAYIPDDKIIENESCEEVIYEDEGIYAANADRIVARNLQKRESILRLRGRNEIWKIPYRVYYMSCNLDHVLHNKRNSSDDEKENDAYAFAEKYKNDIDGFVSFICDSEFSVNGEFKNSWEHIEKDMNSIMRFTNFAICIREEIISQKFKLAE